MTRMYQETKTTALSFCTNHMGWIWEYTKHCIPDVKERPGSKILLHRSSTTAVPIHIKSLWRWNSCVLVSGNKAIQHWFQTPTVNTDMRTCPCSFPMLVAHIAVFRPFCTMQSTSTTFVIFWLTPAFVKDPVQSLWGQCKSTWNKWRGIHKNRRWSK
jgi:hypothetical protein